MNVARTESKIAITIWGQRVSPVFDSARALLIAEFDGTTLTGTSLLAFDPDRPLELLHMLRTQGVNAIICGAVSEGPAALLEAAGIELIPFIAGDVRHILEQYLHGQPFGAEFRMPGCGKQICCRGRIRRGQEIVAPRGGQARKGNARPAQGSGSAPDEAENTAAGSASRRD